MPQFVANVGKRHCGRSVGVGVCCAPARAHIASVRAEHTYGLARNRDPGGSSPGLGRMRPDPIAMPTAGHCWWTMCARVSPSKVPGRFTSVNTTCTSARAWRTARASSALAHSMTVKPASASTSAAIMRTSISSSTTKTTEEVLGDDGSILAPSALTGSYVGVHYAPGGGGGKNGQGGSITYGLWED